MDELQQKVAEIKSRPGERIEPLPEIKPYESFTYNAQPAFAVRAERAGAQRCGQRRSPGRRSARASSSSSSRSTRMKMVGTLELQGKNYGLVQGKDGLVHRVLPGNFMGQNDGRVVGVTSTRISIIEIVPDGLGGYIERPAALALTE